MAAPPAVGTSAPDFHLQDQNGKWHTLDEYAGKWVVLYFYPKDGTPGCTKEVCKFRDEIAKVRAAGAEVLGVSVDDVGSHEEFARSTRCPFPLLADSDKSTAKAYGVLTSKFGFTLRAARHVPDRPAGKIAEALSGRGSGEERLAGPRRPGPARRGADGTSVAGAGARQARGSGPCT